MIFEKSKGCRHSQCAEFLHVETTRRCKYFWFFCFLFFDVSYFLETFVRQQIVTMAELYSNHTDERDDGNDSSTYRSSTSSSSVAHHHQHDGDDGDDDVVRATPLSRCEVRAPILRAFVRRRPSRSYAVVDIRSIVCSILGVVQRSRARLCRRTRILTTRFVRSTTRTTRRFACRFASPTTWRRHH